MTIEDVKVIIRGDETRTLEMKKLVLSSIPLVAGCSLVLPQPH